MKKLATIFFTLALCFSLAACGNNDTPTRGTPDETPFTQADKASKVDDNTIKMFLESTFNLDGFDTLVDISDGEANVFLTSDMISQAYMEASSGDENAIKQWDDLVTSFLGLHNVAFEFVSEYSDNSISTTINSEDNFPYISITDGEVTIDLLHLND